MRRQVAQGRQCYVICPMVEESESLEAENVMDYSQMLAEEMGDNIRVGCLHGKMKQQEKDAVMEAFGKNEIQILVSTTVVEVGIDVPNAAVIMIENAERFGWRSSISSAAVWEEGSTSPTVSLCPRQSLTRPKKGWIS